HSNKIPLNIRKRIICATWLRAELLNRPDVAKGLSADLANAYPPLAKTIQQYNSASSDSERKFALAKVVLRNFGMTPYVQSGVPRHGTKIDAFDWYNANFWLPLPVKAVPKKDDDSYSDPWKSIAPPGDNKIADQMR